MAAKETNVSSWRGWQGFLDKAAQVEGKPVNAITLRELHRFFVLKAASKKSDDNLSPPPKVLS
jgi:hypothetical protein